MPGRGGKSGAPYGRGFMPCRQDELDEPRWKASGKVFRCLVYGILVQAEQLDGSVDTSVCLRLQGSLHETSQNGVAQWVANLGQSQTLQTPCLAVLSKAWTKSGRGCGR